jgi:hypothetical protein
MLFQIAALAYVAAAAGSGAGAGSPLSPLDTAATRSLDTLFTQPNLAMNETGLSARLDAATGGSRVTTPTSAVDTEKVAAAPAGGDGGDGSKILAASVNVDGALNPFLLVQKCCDDVDCSEGSPAWPGDCSAKFDCGSIFCKSAMRACLFQRTREWDDLTPRQAPPPPILYD